jgi:hypothetical protein
MDMEVEGKSVWKLLPNMRAQPLSFTTNIAALQDR